MEQKGWIFREGKRRTDTRSLELLFCSLCTDFAGQLHWLESKVFILPWCCRTPGRKLERELLAKNYSNLSHAVFWNRRTCNLKCCVKWMKTWQATLQVQHCAMVCQTILMYRSQLKDQLDSISGFYTFLEISAKSSSVSTLHKALP